MFIRKWSMAFALLLGLSISLPLFAQNGEIESLFKYYDQLESAEGAANGGDATGAIAAGGGEAATPAPFESAAGATTDFRSASRNYGAPVYIEYNGKRYPLKGLVIGQQSVPLSQEDQQLFAAMKKEVALMKAAKDGNEEALKKLKSLKSDREANFPRSKEYYRSFTDNGQRMIAAPQRLDQAPTAINMQPSAVDAMAIQEPYGPVNGGPLGNVSRVTDLTLFEGRNARYYKRPKFLLPAPADTNDLFYSPYFDVQQTRLGAEAYYDGNGLLEALSLEDVSANVRFTPSFLATYDTRTAGDGFNIANLSTSRLATDGQSNLSGEFDEVPATLLFDSQMFNQVLPILSNANQVQMYLEANNHQDTDELEIRHLYGRIWDLDNMTVAAGKTQSMFGTNGMAPRSLGQQTRLIGAVDLAENNRSQLRFQYQPLEGTRNLAWGFAFEDPFNDDIILDPAAQTTLDRWPTVVGNVAYTGRNPSNRLQLAAMARNLGLENNATGVESFELAWGLSAFGQRVIRNCENLQGTMFFGVAGGEGVGQYISGVSNSALFNGTNLELLQSLGAYVGYSQRWISRRGLLLNANMAYGASFLNNTAGLGADLNEELNQAWVNLNVKKNDQVGYGVEWQHGRRETFAGGHGENNRIFLGIQITTQKAGNVASALTPEAGAPFESASSVDTSFYSAEEMRASRAYRQGL